MRNDEGQVIQGRSEVFEGEVKAEFAEAMAVKEALSWSKEMGWRKVVVESDCLGVIPIRSKVHMVSPVGKIILDCRRLVVESDTKLSFIKRSANMVAHCLARQSCFFPGRVFDRRFVPVEVESMLLADLFE